MKVAEAIVKINTILDSGNQVMNICEIADFRIPDDIADITDDLDCAKSFIAREFKHQDINMSELVIKLKDSIEKFNKHPNYEGTMKNKYMITTLKVVENMFPEIMKEPAIVSYDTKEAIKKWLDVCTDVNEVKSLLGIVRDRFPDAFD
jgi:hypothetical protein